jgi:hypothetical protein
MIFSVRSEEVNRAPVLARFLENLRILRRGFLEISLGDLDDDRERGPDRASIAPEALDDASLNVTCTRWQVAIPFFLIELTLEFCAGRLEPEVLPPAGHRLHSALDSPGPQASALTALG